MGCGVMTYAQAVEVTDYSNQALMDAKWVAGRVEISCRQEVLSFEHHKAVAPLDPEDQKWWLGKSARWRYAPRKMSQHLSKTGALGKLCSPKEQHSRNSVFLGLSVL